MKKIFVTYIGLRVWNQDKVAPVFIDNNGDEVSWKNAKYCRIGYKYETTKKGKEHLMARTPKENGIADVPEKLIREWELQDQAAREFQKRKRAAKKAEKFNYSGVSIKTLRNEIAELDHRTRKSIIELVELYLMFGEE